MEWVAYSLIGAAGSLAMLFVFIVCVKQGEREQKAARHRRPDDRRRKAFEMGGFIIIETEGVPYDQVHFVDEEGKTVSKIVNIEG